MVNGHGEGPPRGRRAGVGVGEGPGRPGISSCRLTLCDQSTTLKGQASFLAYFKKMGCGGCVTRRAQPTGPKVDRFPRIPADNQSHHARPARPCQGVRSRPRPSTPMGPAGNGRRAEGRGGTRSKNAAGGEGRGGRGREGMPTRGLQRARPGTADPVPPPRRMVA